LIDDAAHLGFRDQAGDGVADRLAQAVARVGLEPGPRHNVRAADDFHAPGRMCLEHAGLAQLVVGPRHVLRVGEQFLSPGAVVRQASARLQRPRGDVGHELADDLLMDRHRGIVLQVDHSFDASCGGGGLQYAGEDSE